MNGVEAWNGVLLEKERERTGRTGKKRGIGRCEDGDRSGGREIGVHGGGGELLEAESGEDGSDESGWVGQELWLIYGRRERRSGGGEGGGSGGEGEAEEESED